MSCKRFDYKIVVFKQDFLYNTDAFELELVSLGAVGWELIHQINRIKKDAIEKMHPLNPTTIESELICIFKKELANVDC